MPPPLPLLTAMHVVAALLDCHESACHGMWNSHHAWPSGSCCNAPLHCGASNRAATAADGGTW